MNFVKLALVVISCLIVTSMSAMAVRCEGDCENGHGASYLENGRKVYEGQWKHGKYDGSGVLLKSDGSKVYEGQWKKGERDGQGTSYGKDGKISEAKWSKGKKVK